MSNSVDPDETSHHEPSQLDLCCLQKPIIVAYGSERVKQMYLPSQIIFIRDFVIVSSVGIKKKLTI